MIPATWAGAHSHSEGSFTLPKLRSEVRVAGGYELPPYSPASLAHTYLNWITGSARSGARKRLEGPPGNIDDDARLCEDRSSLLVCLDGVDRYRRQANRWRLALQEIQANAPADQASSEGQATLASLKRLSSEVQQLKLSLGGTELPLSWSAAGSSPVHGDSGSTSTDIVVSVGIEFAEQILAQSELLLTCLTSSGVHVS